ncbi:MAG: hypothetical protein KJ077_33070 [Anaerolineae bacterium]|nr:hypothetical protein [Anaerolineae bacterium]
MAKPRRKNYSKDQLWLFAELAEEADTISDIRARESQLRTEAEVRITEPVSHNFPPLIFPQRWELLKAEAEKRNVPIKPLIMPVQQALIEIEKERQQIEETGMGRLFIMSGVSGSGKSTFLNSLDLFIEGVSVHTITIRAIDRAEVIEDKLATLKREKRKMAVVVLEGKESPGALKSDELDILLTTLNADFRRGAGKQTLFVIPTTSQAVAQTISQRASDIGGMTTRSRPFYVYVGPPRSDYEQITDKMLRALNDSRGLFDYGITSQTAKGIAESSESIGQFMISCYEEIKRQQDALKATAFEIKRKNLHLWMIFCSFEEDNRRNYDIIRSLTISNYQYAQVGRMLTGDSNEIKFWEGRQAAFALAAQYLDLRVMYMPMRTANAIVTAYGSKELIDKLKEIELSDGEAAVKRESVRAIAQESIMGIAIGTYLRNEEFIERDIVRRNKPSERHKILFREFMKLSNDKDLNALVAQTLRDSLKTPGYSVYTELSLDENGHLITDIAVVTPTDIFCLEFKWRSSLLAESEITRETVGRVKDFAIQLPELRNVLGRLD